MRYDRTRDMMIGHDYPGVYGNGMHGFLLDELEVGARAAMALDDPEQWWWEVHRDEIARHLAFTEIHDTL